MTVTVHLNHTIEKCYLVSDLLVNEEIINYRKLYILRNMMNLFELFSKLNHPSSKRGWIETNAVFTGKTGSAVIGKPGYYNNADYLKYEIKYYTNDEERTGWYVFYPLDDPDPDDIAGQELHIRYNKNKPWLFEAVAGINFD